MNETVGQAKKLGLFAAGQRLKIHQAIQDSRSEER